MIVPRDADPGLRVCAQAWAEGLREAGLEVSSADAVDASRDATAVIVAPHAALRPLAHDPLRIAGLLQRAVCLSTSRLGSGALGADRPFHSAASASVGLSRDASRYLSAHGAPTAHLKPGSHPRAACASAAERAGGGRGARALLELPRGPDRALARRPRSVRVRPAHLAQRRGPPAGASRRRRLAVVAHERRRARLAAAGSGTGDGLVRARACGA